MVISTRLAARGRPARLAAALAAGLALAAIAAGIALAVSGPSGAWRLEWAQQFSGAAGTPVSTRYWHYDTGQGGFGTGEVETMTSSAANVYLDGHGDLDITAIDSGGAWTSGRIQTTSAAFAAPAGGQLEVSASIRQPAAADGLGYWPAFWLLGPGTWPGSGEIDILEDVNAISAHSGALHCGNLVAANSDGTFGPCHEYTGLSSGLRPCPACQSRFQTYSVVIDRRTPGHEQISWYLNGAEFFSVSQSRIGQPAWTRAVDHGFSIILDLAVGGRYPDTECGCTAPVPQTTPRATLSVRWIRVRTWQAG